MMVLVRIQNEQFSKKIIFTQNVNILLLRKAVQSMRTKNIEITMKLPFQVKKPDQNGVVYSQEAILDAIKKSKLGTG